MPHTFQTARGTRQTDSNRKEARRTGPATVFPRRPVVYKGSNHSQMATLNDMLLAELIKIGDTIEFTFKGNTFTAKILRGGLIGKCQQQTLHEDAKDVLTNTVGFSSLTAWTESCLQDLLEEYYTRYSSWKRVFHRESKRSMSDLRDQCKLKDTKRKSDDVMELYKEIFRLQTTIDEMNDHIDRLHRGEKCVYKKWTYLHIEPQPNIVPPAKKIKTKHSPLVTSAAEDALCDDSSPISQVVTEIIRT